MRYLILIIFSAFFFLNLGAQSGWTQPKGKGFFKLNQSFLRAGSFFNLEGDIIDITTTSVYISSLYGEYGITDRLTAVAYVPFFVRSTINERESTVNGVVEPGDELNGVGDPQIGLKYGIIKKGPVVLAGEVILGIPLGQNVGGDTELLQTGDGEFNQLVRLVASTSFGNSGVYGSLAVGYNNRTSGDFEFRSGTEEDVQFSDEFHWGGELGWQIGEQKKWLLALKWYQVIAMDNGDQTMGMSNTSLFGNNVEYL